MKTTASQMGQVGPDLCSIQSHAKALGPGQLLGKGSIGGCLLDDIRKGAPGAELNDDADGGQAQAHEHDHIGMANGSHDGHLCHIDTCGVIRTQ